MNLQFQQGPLDEASQQDGDAYFAGVNERLAPMQLSAGYTSRSYNTRYRNGQAEPRRGIVLLPMARGTGLTPFSNPFYAAVFRDPNQAQSWILVADEDGMWKTRPNNAATAVPLPAGVTLTRATCTQLVQCMGVLILLRGPDEDPLVCTDLDAGFVPIAAAVDAGTTSIPPSSFGLYFNNRLWLIQGLDNVAVSDISDYTQYQAIQSTFKINEGEDDALLAIYPFGSATLIFFKERRVWKVENAVGDLADAAGPLKVTSKYGISSARCVADAGSECYWLSDAGIVSLRLTALNEDQATTQTLSDPMTDMMNRIAGAYRDRCVMEIWDNKLYFAHPRDDAFDLGPELAGGAGNYDAGGLAGLTILTAGRKYLIQLGTNDLSAQENSVDAPIYYGDFFWTATVASLLLTGTPDAAVTLSVREVLHEGACNAVGVYDFVNGAWAGVDTGDALRPVNFLKFPFYGRERLLFLSADGYIKLYEEGFEDEVIDGGLPEDWAIATLYAAGDVVQANHAVFIALQENSGIEPGTGFGWEDYWAYHAVTMLTAVETDVTTRGYPNAGTDKKRYTGLLALQSTWAPNYSISIITDGVAAETAYIENRTRSRVIYDAPPGKPDWDPENPNDDHGARGREDYSVALLNAYPGVTAEEMNLGSNGVNTELHQESTERLPIDERGHFAQLRIVNTEGRHVLRAVLTEAVTGDRPSGITL